MLIKNKNSLLYKLLLALILLVLASILAANFVHLRATLKDSYTNSQRSAIENELNVSENSFVLAVNNYYLNALNVIENIANNSQTYNAISSNGVSTLANTLDEERSYNQEFDNLIAYTSANQPLAASSASGNVSIGSTATVRPSILAALTAHRSEILPAYINQAHQLVVDFVAPVIEASGKYAGAISGNATLQALTNQISFASDNHSFANVLIDSNGNVLDVNNSPVSSLVNVNTKEPLLHQLTKNDNSVLVNETNYQGQKVIAEGTLIDFKDYGKVYALSFASDKSVTTNVDSSLHTFKNSYLKYLLVNILVIVIFIAVCWYAISKIKSTKSLKIKHHEKA